MENELFALHILPMVTAHYAHCVVQSTSLALALLSSILKLYRCLLIHLRPSLPASLSGGTRMEAASVEYSTSDTAFIRFCALSVSISVASLSDSGSAAGNSEADT